MQLIKIFIVDFNSFAVFMIFREILIRGAILIKHFRAKLLSIYTKKI